MKTTQRMKILKHLQCGLSIPPMDALDRYKCFRLAARISELREDGYQITTDMSHGYARYALAGEAMKEREMA